MKELSPPLSICGVYDIISIVISNCWAAYEPRLYSPRVFTIYFKDEAQKVAVGFFEGQRRDSNSQAYRIRERLEMMITRGGRPSDY
jgi:hypothetical protein